MAWPYPLRSLRRPLLRRFFLGQTLSLLGSWVQPVAVSWLAWRLTHSERVLGLVTFVSQAPVLLLGGFAGAVADRWPRKPVMMAALVNALVQALALAVLTYLELITPWMLLSLSALLALTYSFEIPSRQAFVAELAGDDVANAVALNSTVVTSMRVLGPALGGAIVATVGEAWCFLANAISFLFVLGALATIPVETPAAAQRALVTWREGLRFVRSQPAQASALWLLLAASLVGQPYGTLMPVVAEQVLRGGPGLLGQLLSSAGVGALAGALLLLVRDDPRALGGKVGWGAGCMGIGILALSLSSSVWLSTLALLVLGFGQMTLSTSTLTLLQASTPSALRGRVIGLFTTVFVGAAPFGALAVGWSAHRFGVLLTLRAQGAVVLVAACAYGWARWRDLLGPPR